MDAELLKQQRQKEIAEAQIQVQIASEQKNIELAQKQAERTKESLRVTMDWIQLMLRRQNRWQMQMRKVPSDCTGTGES